MTTCEGTFEVAMTGEPAYDDGDGVILARARIDKTFKGALEATSTVHMIAARTPEKGSAGYVACEKIRGTLEGRAGSFVAVHLGLMDRGADSLVIQIVPGSGTEGLEGLRGTMAIRIVDKQHIYQVDYTLP